MAVNVVGNGYRLYMMENLNGKVRKRMRKDILALGVPGGNENGESFEDNGGHHNVHGDDRRSDETSDDIHDISEEKINDSKDHSIEIDGGDDNNDIHKTDSSEISKEIESN